VFRFLLVPKSKIDDIPHIRRYGDIYVTGEPSEDAEVGFAAVAEGVEFTNGSCAVRQLAENPGPAFRPVSYDTVALAAQAVEAVAVFLDD
jgi:hypothetical protein